MSNQDTDNIKAAIAENKKRFSAYNSAKLFSLQTALGETDGINLIDYIPLLFAVNLPDLPGYLTELSSAHGIYNYQIPSNLLTRLRVSNPSFSVKNPQGTDPLIKLFALIGSAGTIAFTPDSDLDFWICGNFNKMDSESLSLLRRKCAAIEKWAMEFRGVEVHFFINDMDSIKQNIFDEDEEYGLSGTSLGQMLKEEFYRSSIILNNVIPVWWVVPSDCSDEQYRQWQDVIDKSADALSFIDLGNLQGINKSDFLIAALFQIIKSLGNPFKSLIKLGLLERYLNDDIKNPFVSNLIKKNIQEGRTDIPSTDPYCIMFDQVYDYYTAHGDDVSSINIIKTCFYLKVNPRLSGGGETVRAGDENLKKIMNEYVRKWNWSGDVIKRVDNFETWDIDSTNKMMNNTKKIILRGYKNILNILGSQIYADSAGNKALTGINRKIYSHFSNEDNKIDNTLNFKKYPPEKILSLEYIRDVKGNEVWFLNRSAILGNKQQKIPIRKSPHLLTLIVWMSLNGIYQKDFTRLVIEQGFYSMDPNYIRDLISELTARFSIKGLQLHNSYFLREPFPLMNYIIINPFNKYSKKIDEFFYLYHNSWGETRFEVFHDAGSLADVAARIATGIRISQSNENTALCITSSDPLRGSKEFLILKTTLMEMMHFFSSSSQSVKMRFFTMIANRLTIFSNKVKKGDNSAVSFTHFVSETQMLYAVSYNKGLMNRSCVDEKVPELDYIKQILSSGNENSVKIFFNRGDKYSRFFVVNERGSLFFFRKKSEYFQDYLIRLILFAESAVLNVLEYNPDSSLSKIDKKIEVFKIDIEPSGKSSITISDYENEPGFSSYKEKNLQVTLSLHLLETGEIGYRFTLPDGMNSDIFSRDEVESVSREISTLMESVKGYNFIPSAVNLEYIEIPMYASSTSLAFSEKNRFEIYIEKNIGKI